ncbi:MAG: hypothetical protein IJA80_02425 [Clostridia bacterium]|nr:hypothetical protein [Clostridia bacterium]
MTDNEIKKAFEEHIERTKNIKYGARKMAMVDVELLKNTLDLINHNDEEINKLKYQVNRLKQYDEKRDIDLHSRLKAEARAEAIKEVLDEITEILHEAEMHGNYEPSLTIEIINDIKEKMRVDNE